MAEQRIQLAEAQAKAIATQDGPQIDFSADMERQKMSAEGLMGPFALNDPAAGTTGPWYTNGLLNGGLHSHIWERIGRRLLPAWVRLKHGRRNASKPANCWLAA